jgi:hypothetical protein
MSLGALIGGITRDLVSSCAQEPQKQNKNKKRTECVVCFDQAARVACVPCGHMCLCVIDAPRVDACPICRARIEHRLTVFD